MTIQKVNSCLNQHFSLDSLFKISCFLLLSCHWSRHQLVFPPSSLRWVYRSAAVRWRDHWASKLLSGIIQVPTVFLGVDFLICGALYAAYKSTAQIIQVKILFPINNLSHRYLWFLIINKTCDCLYSIEHSYVPF